MIFRTAEESEKNEIYRVGYAEWGEDMSFTEFVSENEDEEKNGGLHHVLVHENKICASLIVTPLGKIPRTDYPLYAIGSLIVPKNLRGKGYGAEIIHRCIQHHLAENDNYSALLYSDINPLFYKKLGFVALPEKFQTISDSVCMIHCKEEIYEQLLPHMRRMIPSYILNQY